MRSCSMRLYAITLCLCASTAFAQSNAQPDISPLAQQLTAITTEPAVARAHWGIAVTALDGTPIYGLNEGEFFRPASNTKLFTTAAAMQLLGPASQVNTAVTAFIGEHGDVRGDVTLIGAGDANISGRSFPYVSPAERKHVASGTPPSNPLQYLDELADGLAKAGVTHVSGNVIGDDTIWPFEPYASDWTIDDAVWGYGAPVSALTINDNQLQLAIKPTAIGKLATVTLIPETSFYKLDVNVMTVPAKSHASIRIDREQGSKLVRVTGTIAVGEPYSTDIAIEDPAEFAAQAFKQLLEARGIAVDGKGIAHHKFSSDTADFSDESHVPLPRLTASTMTKIESPAICLDACPTRIEHTSPTLADDIVLTLKVSQNLHAELLLRRLGKQYGTDGSTAQGARVVRQFLLNAGLDPDDFIFYDGSGLSSHNLVTPRATAKLLAYATTQPWFEQWKAGLPIGGEDGTLSGRFAQPPLKDHLFAKTGTLGESRALSGYVDCASGKTVIFSIMVDNHSPTTHADRDAVDRIVAAIASDN